VVSATLRLEGENIRPRVVSRNVESHEFRVDIRQVEISDDQFFAIIKWLYDITCVRCDDGTATSLQLLTSHVLDISF